MLHRTEGIILHTVKFSESSLILKVYTGEFGLQSYMINGVHGKKSKHRSALLQPLTLVNLIASNSNRSGLHKITEMNLSQPYVDLPYNIIKSSIAIFLNEILYKVLKEEHPDADLFEFIRNSLLLLDLKQGNCSAYHIYFMIQLSAYLGFAPQGSFNATSGSFFDLREGRFIQKRPAYPQILAPESSKLFYELLQSSFENFGHVRIAKVQRKELLQALIVYYQLHIPGFGELKSVSVLEELTATS